MALLISFLIGIQLFHAVVSVPFPLFLSPSCDSLEVRTAAEVALNKHNAGQTEGYVLGLQRISDVQEVIKGDESVFNLVLDVLETKCHVRSRKPWKECEFRPPHETVFGHCEIIIKYNRKTNDSSLHRNDCILHPFPSSSITRLCPDCPRRGNPSENNFQETARDSLAKFNAENGHEHYFAILEVTKASLQWVVGPSYNVEYTIQETSCRKGSPVSDVNQCPLLPIETAEAGLCKGSVSKRQVIFEKIVTVQCDFFPQPPPVKDGQTSQSTSEPQELHPPHVTVTETSPKQKEAVVPVINHHYDVPQVSSTFASLQQEVKSTIPPYPRRFSQSDDCPGTFSIEILGLQLPSGQRAETSQTKSDVQH